MSSNKTNMTSTLDLQVNGFKGISFSDLSLNTDSFVDCCNQLSQAGTDYFLPTVITVEQEIYDKNLPVMAKIIKSGTVKVPGIHLEGPFLSPAPGARGAHNPKFMKSAETDLFDKLYELAKETVKLVTVAADIPNAPKLIEHIVSLGIAVSLGHQDATVEQLQEATSAGATLLTHLGNGMPTTVHRHKNQLSAGLAIDELTAMIITDGHHLPPEIIKTIIRTKGLDKVIITSDAAPLAGMPPGKYETLGNNVLLEESGLLHSEIEPECLVGSSATLAQCVSYCKSLDIANDTDIDNMATKNPWNVINLT